MGIVGTSANSFGKFGCAGEIGIGDTPNYNVIHTGQYPDMPFGDASCPDEA